MDLLPIVVGMFVLGSFIIVSSLIDYIRNKKSDKSDTDWYSYI